LELIRLHGSLLVTPGKPRKGYREVRPLARGSRWIAHPQQENWLSGARHAAQQPALVLMVQGVDDRGLVSFADAVGVVLLMKFSVTIGERHVGPGSAVTGARHRPPANCLATCTPGKQEKRYIPKLSFHCRNYPHACLYLGDRSGPAVLRAFPSLRFPPRMGRARSELCRQSCWRKWCCRPAKSPHRRKFAPRQARRATPSWSRRPRASRHPWVTTGREQAASVGRKAKPKVLRKWPDQVAKYRRWARSHNATIPRAQPKARNRPSGENRTAKPPSGALNSANRCPDGKRESCTRPSTYATANSLPSGERVLPRRDSNSGFGRPESLPSGASPRF